MPDLESDMVVLFRTEDRWTSCQRGSFEHRREHAVRQDSSLGSFLMLLLYILYLLFPR
jgi:hypothetical protein